MRTNALPNDVVLLRTIELDDAEIGPRPMDAVAALGVANHFGMDVLTLPRRVDDVRSAIVHAVEIAILKHGGITAGIALPRLVAFE